MKMKTLLSLIKPNSRFSILDSTANERKQCLAKMNYAQYFLIDSEKVTTQEEQSEEREITQNNNTTHNNERTTTAAMKIPHVQRIHLIVHCIPFL